MSRRLSGCRSCTRPTRPAATRGPAPWPYCSMRRPPVAAPHRALPRRGRVVLVVRSEPQAADFQAAIAVGAQHVITLPAHDGELMAELSDAADACRDEDRRGAVVGVIAGRGGAGASVFATALAQTARRCAARRRRPVGWWHRPGSGLRGRDRSALAGSHVARRSAQLFGVAGRVAATTRGQRVVGQSHRQRHRRRAAGRGDRRRQPRRRDRDLRPAPAIDRRGRDGARRGRPRRRDRSCRRAVVRRRRGDRAVGVGGQSQRRRGRAGPVAGWPEIGRRRTRSSDCRCWPRCGHSRVWPMPSSAAGCDCGGDHRWRPRRDACSRCCTSIRRPPHERLADRPGA